MKKITKNLLFMFLVCTLISISGAIKASAYTNTSGTWSLNRAYPKMESTINLKAPWYSSGKDHDTCSVELNCTYGSVNAYLYQGDTIIARCSLDEGEEGSLYETNLSASNKYKLVIKKSSTATEGEYSICTSR